MHQETEGTTRTANPQPDLQADNTGATGTNKRPAPDDSKAGPSKETSSAKCLKVDKEDAVLGEGSSDGVVRTEITDLDRLRSFLGCSRETMDTYIDVLEEDSSFSELLHALSLSSEFSDITVRDEETQELAELRKHAVAFIREGPDVPSAKVNVLLQAFILQLKPDPELSPDLKSDMALVEKTAGKLVRAIFEICLYKGWARLADKSLTLCKMVERRIWHSMTWLRQFRVEAAELGATEEDFKKIDDLDIKWFSYYWWSLAEIEKHLKMPGKGEAIQTAVCQVPGVKLSAPHVRPVSRTWLQVKLTIKAASHFTTWNDNVHGDSQAFWVVATASDQDTGREVVLHREYFQLEKKYWKEEHVLNFPVLLSEPPHGQYTIRAVSDEWLALETRRTVRVSDLFKPAESPQPTVLHLDLEPVPVSDVMVGVRKDEEYGYKALYKDVTHFNPIQTQVFESLYNSDDNVFVGAPMGSGKSVCAEFAILRLLKNKPLGLCVYVAPNKAKVDQMYKEWSQRLDQYLFMDVIKLTGKLGDKDLIQTPNGLVMIVATPEQLYTVLPRRGELCMRNAYACVDLFIMDDLHLIGRESRSLLEIVCSRMCFTRHLYGTAWVLARVLSICYSVSVCFVCCTSTDSMI